MRRSHRSRTEGHPLDATIPRPRRDQRAVRRSQPRVVCRAGAGDGPGRPLRPDQPCWPNGLTLAGKGTANAAGEDHRPDRGHGRGRGLDHRHGPAAPRRHGPRLRRGAGALDAGHVPAPVHLRSRPPTRRRRRRAAGPARRRDPAAARRRPDRVRRHRRHRAPDLRLRQAGRRPRLHRREGLERAARRALDPDLGAGDRRDPVAEGIDQLGPGRGETARRRAGHRPPRRRRTGPQRDGAGAGGLGLLRLRHHQRLPPGRGPVLRHRPAHPVGGQGHHQHQRSRLDRDPLPERDLRRGRAAVGVRRRSRRGRLHRVHRAPPAPSTSPPG